MMCVVCDTGPLTHLWQIELWPAFSAFEVVHIPEQVSKELTQHVALERFERQAGCKLNIHPISLDSIESSKTFLDSLSVLHTADLAVFSLAKMLKPDFVLTDDLTFRRALESQGHDVMGSVGLLLYAHKTGLLNRQKLEYAIDRLFVHSTLYLSPQFKSYVRKLIGTQLDK